MKEATPRISFPGLYNDLVRTFIGNDSILEIGTHYRSDDSTPRYFLVNRGTSADRVYQQATSDIESGWGKKLETLILGHWHCPEGRSQKPEIKTTADLYRHTGYTARCGR